MNLFIIEDDESLFQAMKQQLEKWGWHVTGVNDFSKVYEEFKAIDPELIIIDIQLPKYDGFYWCRMIRNQSNVPIVFLSSREHPMDQVMSMELGADDFIQKPFHTEVLVAKLQAIYRRVYKYNKDEPRTKLWNGAKVDYGKHIIEKDGIEISLTKNEMFILEMLLNHKNEIVTRNTIITALWDDEQFVSDNTLTVNVNRLRKKLADINFKDMIETKVGKGYIAHEPEGENGF